MRNADVFVGRADELHMLRTAAEKAAQGDPWLVEVRGEAGVGKTALLRHLAEGLPGFTALWATGDPAETDYAFGLVGQLVSRVGPEHLTGLPLLGGPLAPGAAPFAVGAELVRLVGELQGGGQSVLLVVDDLQWADTESARALSFLLRRLWADSVLTVLSVRGGRNGLHALDPSLARLLLRSSQVLRIELGGMTPHDVRLLARALGQKDLDGATISELHGRTGGNALYLRTILSECPARVLTGDLVGRAAPSSIALSIGAQVRALPGPSQALLEALAVVDAPRPLAQVARLAGVEEPATALEHALRAGLMDWDPMDPTSPVALRHRLQRDAVYAMMSPARRRELHAAAAGLVDADAAWAHRVAAADSTDPVLAEELERAARAATAAGHSSRAGSYLLWASRLSTDRADRETRLLSGAVELAMSESCSRVRKLRDEAVVCSESPLRSFVLGAAAFYGLDSLEAERWFTAALDEIERTGRYTGLTASVALSLQVTYLWQGRAEAAEAAGRRALDEGTLDPRRESFARGLLLQARAMLTGPAAVLRDAPAGPDDLLWRGLLRLDAGRLAAAGGDLSAVVQRLKEATVTPFAGTRALHGLALVRYFQGSWDEAAALVDQSLSVTRAEGRLWDLAPAHMAAALLTAGRGEGDRAAGHARRAHEAAQRSGAQQDVVAAAVAEAAVAHARGDHAGVLQALEPLAGGTGEPPAYARLWKLLWRPQRVEALIHTGEYGAADEELRELRDTAPEPCFLTPTWHRLDGMLAERRGETGTALAHYRAGLAERPTADDFPLGRAELALACGRLLRRTGRRKDAVKLLHESRALLAALGAKPVLDRCEEELIVSGAHRNRGGGRGLLELTAREREVAHLVARGLTNKEIAAELFLSEKTIEFHLRSIFTKLAVTSRRQLRDQVLRTRR
ncbi:AAA family ATPase [Streptomyces sp. TRM64462]|uniref:ATP-binding protein n=1 Tax=Streptomyces sp. TRM64462 TaxID=2741726 RepID=UPI0015861039|nr:LuxR family transcriptional regulator [Streptomyces sp. TRM64462]